MIRRLRRALGRLVRQCRDDRGSVTVQNMVWLATLLAASGFAIDTANAFRTKAMLQAAADAAALAAVLDLPDAAEARRTARAFTEVNLPPSLHGQVLNVTDVQIGAWLDGAFRAGELPADAVRVEVGRTEGRGNALPTLLLKLVGKVDFNLEADAVARRGADGGAVEDPCAAGGFAAEGEALVGSSNHLPDGWCLHGEQAIEIGAENVFDRGSVLTLEDDEELYEGWGNTGVDEATFEQSLSVSLPRLTPELDIEFRQGLGGLPDYVARGPFRASRLPRRLVSDSLYIISGPVEIPAGAVLNRIAIVADGPLTIGDDATLVDVVLLSGGAVTFGIGATLGPPTVCDEGVNSVYVFAKGDVGFGASATLRGVQIAAGGSLQLGPSPRQILGVYGEAMRDVDVGDRTDFEACPEELASEWPETTWSPVAKLAIATSLTR